VQVSFPSASIVVHASANRYPSTPRRAPDRRLPARPVAPGAVAAPRPGGPPGLCHLARGCQHLMGNHNLQRRSNHVEIEGKVALVTGAF